jgi:Calcineurin-like phosphoesterase
VWGNTFIAMPCRVNFPFLLPILLALPLCALAFPEQADPKDSSKADTDGPHVFYRGDKVVVKYVVMRDTGAKAVTQIFPNTETVGLTCMIPETKDKFSFSIRQNLSTSPAVYPASKRLLALSDIEGNFEAMKLMLQSAGVMDTEFNWSFGDGDLVLVGDFFDRGLNVTECLWLLYKLDGEAEKAGGKLHFILGNHEIMNLQGNTKYMRSKYFENARLMQMDYKYWYDHNSELGRWLRSKNAIERIGDYVFCHGGISLDMVNMGLNFEEINRHVQENIGKTEQEITSPEAKLIFDTKVGVFWYRALAKSLVTAAEVDTIMDYLEGKKLVLGHTLQQDIAAYYDGRVICIDLYHEELLRQGFVKALWVENGKAYALTSKGIKSSISAATIPSNKTE